MSYALGVIKTDLQRHLHGIQAFVVVSDIPSSTWYELWIFCLGPYG